MMKFTKQLLREIIEGEVKSILQEKMDPKLEAAAIGMALVSGGLKMAMSQAQAGGRPPDLMADGKPIFQWFVDTTKLDLEVIAAAARKKKVTVSDIPD